MEEAASSAVIRAKDALETVEWGRTIGGLLRPGHVLGLIGDLGSGKTTFAKGILEGIGVAGPVKSPTYAIVHQHEGPRFPVFHLDVYRLQNPDELDSLGCREIFYGPGVAVVEWADLILGRMPENRLEVYFSYGPDDIRDLTFKAVGQGFDEIINRLKTGHRGQSAENPGN